MILFYVLTKKYATKTRFIPTTNEKLSKLTMNKGIFVGAILFVLGIVGSIVAVVLWSKTGFGELVPEDMLRLTIPTLILMVNGIQLMFSSFFLGILDIEVKHE
jgi:hypothetical protein